MNEKTYVRKTRERLAQHLKAASEHQQAIEGVATPEERQRLIDVQYTRPDESEYRTAVAEIMAADFNVTNVCFLVASGLLPAPPHGFPPREYLSRAVDAMIDDDDGVHTWIDLYEYDEGALVRGMLARPRDYVVPKPDFPILARRRVIRGSTGGVGDVLLYSDHLERWINLPVLYYPGDIEALVKTWTFPHEVIHIAQRIGRVDGTPAYWGSDPDGRYVFRNLPGWLYRLVNDELDVQDVLLTAYGDRYGIKDYTATTVLNVQQEMAELRRLPPDDVRQAAADAMERIDWTYYGERFGPETRRRIYEAFSLSPSTP